METIGYHLPLLDIIAFLVFAALWAGYSYIADFTIGREINLVKVMHRYRIQWIKQMIRRDERLVDIRVISNLLSSTTFFASTSIIIIGGFAAVLGYADKASEVFSGLPFVSYSGAELWVIKSALIIFIFIYSFFKLTWVTRQFNYVSVLVLAAPVYHPEQDNEIDEVKKMTRYVNQIATMLSNSARHFNMAIRSYYFGFAALSWYISPILLILLSILVVMVLYRREFMSKTLVLLA